MNKMKIKFLRSYKSQNGTPVFVYEVSGNAETLERFRQIQGDYYREDETTGKPIYFTTRSCGPTGELIITTNDNIVIDTSKFDAAASLAAQYGGNLGQALANKSADALLGNSEEEQPAQQDNSVPAAKPEDMEQPGAQSEGLGDA